MTPKFKNRIVFLIFSAVLGAFIGAFIWAFLKLMNLGMTLLWETIPEMVHIPLYTLLLCLVGGTVIGVFQKKFGAYPEDMDTVLATLKREGKYPYNHILMLSVAAILPLLFGGSIGPEAGMTGIIIGLCCWAGDRFSYMGKNLRDITQMGMSATLSVIFQAPLFGFMLPVEEADDGERMTFPQKQKIVIYFTSILGCFGIFSLLNMLFGGGAGLPSLSGADIGTRERALGIPLALSGVVFGLVYFLIHRGCHLVFIGLQKKNKYIISAVSGGLILGIFGTIFPIAMFSGEAQMHEMAETYLEFAPMMLILIGIVKLLVTNLCIESGWRGGHFFPVIFAGVSIGYGMGMLCGVNEVFTVAVVTSGLMGYIMRKPLAVVLLLLICFPMNCVVWMLIAALIGSNIPVPSKLHAEKTQLENDDTSKRRSGRKDRKSGKGTRISRMQ